MFTFCAERPMRVLVVDDSITIRAIMERIIDNERDMRLVGATSCAVEAQDFLEHHRPDVMTLDVEMPGMNGLDFLTAVLACRKLPVIMVSSHTARGADVRARAFALGASACFDKANLMKDAGRFAAMVRKVGAGKTCRDKPVSYFSNTSSSAIDGCSATV